MLSAAVAAVAASAAVTKHVERKPGSDLRTLTGDGYVCVLVTVETELNNQNPNERVGVRELQKVDRLACARRSNQT